MWLFELLAGIVFGTVVGGVLKMITSGGGGVIVGRENVRNAIKKEERNLHGRFDNLKVTENDPKFYE
ncbi:hypothetical protein [Desulfovibrio sp. TomC]|uniref:hypothetical protein n=1 Tax=Desulfovibrio sp. TomC TaxID=1562888 RepID=UPI0005B8D575|nr:hypothetical protein [Desulfovibrio sp. TomC]